MKKTSTEKKKRRSSKKKKKSPRKSRKDAPSLVEQRILEAQKKVERQEREEKKRIFEAWEHTFDDAGVLVYTNAVLKESQYDCPEGYETGYV